MRSHHDFVRPPLATAREATSPLPSDYKSVVRVGQSTSSRSLGSQGVGEDATSSADRSPSRTSQ